MGNEFSSVRDTPRERRLESRGGRIPLLELDAQEVKVQSTFRGSIRGDSKKRTRTHFTQSQPAGSHVSLGSLGTRWPISGISSDCLQSQGDLQFVSQSTMSDASTVYWRLDLSQYIAEYVDRHGNGLLPRFVCSSVFPVRPIGARLRWKLIIAPKDVEDDSLSVYLQNENSRTGEAFEIDTRYSLFIGDKEQSPQSSYFIRHCFSSKKPVWGIQNMISFNELKEYAKDNELVIGLDLKWVRDSRLFPPQFITLNRHQPELYKICESPKILMVENFLTMSECETLIEKAEPFLYRSRVASGTETPSRTSSSMFFTGTLEKFQIVKSMMQKLVHFIKRPEINEGRNIKPTESLQVVRYRLGEFYSEHYDNRAGHANLRAATIIIYLRETEAGGATYFPKAAKALPNADVLSGTMIGKQELRKEGLRVYPRQGRAIFFWSRLPNGEDDRNSLHSAEPIIEGEKWIATRWFREVDDSS